MQFNANSASSTTTGLDGVNLGKGLYVSPGSDGHGYYPYYIGGAGGGGYPFGGGNSRNPEWITNPRNSKEEVIQKFEFADPGSSYASNSFFKDESLSENYVLDESSINGVTGKYISNTERSVFGKSEEPDPKIVITLIEETVEDEYYLLDIDPNGGIWEGYDHTVSSQPLATGDTYPVSVPTREGYIFTGWTLTGEGSSMSSYTENATFTMGTEDATLTANWKENCTLTVNPNGGIWESSTDSQSFNLGPGATKSISIPWRNGYIFTGWTLEGNGSMTSLTENATFTMGTEDATLTAHWNPITYEVAYNGNGATSGSMSNSTHTYDVDKNLSKNLYERIYHVIYNYNGKPGANEDNVDAVAQFINWKAQSENRTFTDEQSVRNLCSTQNAVYHLDAQWQLATLTLPSPTRTGYTFKGWSTNQNATDGITGSFTPEQDTKLYAIWEPYTAQITFAKRDSITNEILNGAVFGLYEWNGSSYIRISTLTDNGNGTYTTALMTYTDTNQGKFKIVEENAPTYYTNSGYEKEIQITESGYHHYTTGFDITNEPNKVRAQAIKVDSETGNRIEGAIFAIYEWNKETQQYELYSRNDSKNETDETMHFGQDRIYLSEWLYANRKNEGKFKIIEAGTPVGYYGDFNNGNKKENDIIITETNNGQTITIQNGEGVYKNTRVKGTINVNKIDKETNRYLAQGDGTLDGAEYGLYAAEDIYHKDTVTGKIYSRDQLVQSKIITNGTLTYENVEIGRYYVKEITPPVGYIKDETKYEVNVNYEGEAVAHLTREATVIEQIKKQAFNLKKVSSNSTSTELTPLMGAGFKIYLIKDLEGVKNGTLRPSNGVQYTVNDFIGYDFSGEQTALDYSRTSEGERIEEIFSDAQGSVTSPELAYGKYVVIESTVPEDVYPIDPFIVKIEEDSRTPQAQRVVIDKEFEALIKITKKDSQTGQTVLNKNAKYRIWNITENKYEEQTFTYPTKVTYGTEENPYETNEKGEFITPLKLQLGEYELREVKAPEGYILTGHEGKMEQGIYTEQPKQAVKFNVKANTVHYQDPDLKEVVIDVEQYNEQTLGELEITKTGEYLRGTNTREDGTIEPVYEDGVIKGVEFEIYAKEDIYSQDNQGTKLCEKDQLIRKIVTDEQGKAYQDNLPIGKYYIKEVKTVEGFILNKEIKEFEVKYGGEETPVQKVEIDYKNERQKIDLNGKEGLKVEKIADKTVYKPGETITYCVRVSNSSEYEIKNIKVEETMIEGKFEDIKTDNINKTSDKTVEIKELKPGEGVELKFIVTIAEDEKTAEKLETEKVKITNKIKVKGKIEKPDSGLEDIEEEAKEEIYITNKDLVIVKEALKDEYQIGEVAQYVIKVINNGKEDITKILIEEQMLDGRFVYLEESNKNGVEIAGEGQKVAISKIEPGETVILRYEYTITESTKVTLDENHKMLLSNTVIGKGKVEEPDPEDPEKTITREVEDESTEEIQVTEIDNRHIGIIKKDIETGETIQGATIGLYAGEDIKDRKGNLVIAKDSLIEKAETNEWGKAKYSVDLPLGKYYIKEIEAPNCYNLSQEIIEIDGTYQGSEIEEISVSKTLGNRSTGIKIQKKDARGKSLRGAKLEIVDEQGNTIDSWETTDKNHIFRKLEIGKIYVLREVEPAKGYVTAKEIRFTINQDEKVYCIEQESEGGMTLRDLKTVDSIQMIDEITKLEIEVLDKETEKPIPGIKVQIKDRKTGEVIYEYETDENLKIIEGIPIGEYEIITTDPENRGYITETKEMKVIDTDKLQSVKVLQGYTKVEINLKDEDTKELLKEGRFDIIDEKGKVVKTEETKQGIINIERLPLGTYTIHQTETPKGYFESEDIKIEIRDTEDLQIFEILNKKKIVNFSVEKTLSSITLNGQEIEITNNKLAKLEVKTSEIKKAELIAKYNIKVTNEGEVQGKVTVLETIPDGYEILEMPEYWTTITNETLQTEVELGAGGSQDLCVILRWINDENNLGSRTNRAQLEGEEDGNPEDNISEATVVVSIKTGEKVSIIIIGMMIIALVISGYVTYRIIQRKGPIINRIKFLK